MPSKASGINTLTKLRNRCSRADNTDPQDCWVWKGATRPGKIADRAAIWIVDPKTGKGAVVGAARAAAILSGKDLPKGWRSWSSCGNSLCCNPAHERSGTCAEWGQWIEQQGAFKGNPLNAAAAIARARRRSELTPELVAHIKQAPETAAEVAEALGLSLHVVRRARRNPTCWAPPNPFAALVRTA